MTCTNKNKPFFDPPNAGCFTLASTQIGKSINFSSVDGVFIGSPKITAFDLPRSNPARQVVQEYVLGNGLTLSGNNVTGEEKTLNLILDGSLVVNLEYDQQLILECEFFGVGDVDLVFTVIRK